MASGQVWNDMSLIKHRADSHTYLQAGVTDKFKELCPDVVENFVAAYGRPEEDSTCNTWRDMNPNDYSKLYRIDEADNQGCFAAGGLVALHDGSFKPVEEVQPGDLLLCPSCPGTSAVVECTTCYQLDAPAELCCVQG